MATATTLRRALSSQHFDHLAAQCARYHTQTSRASRQSHQADCTLCNRPFSLHDEPIGHLLRIVS